MKKYEVILVVMPIEERDQFRASDNSFHVDMVLELENVQDFCMAVAHEAAGIAGRVNMNRRLSDKAVVPL